MDRLVLLILFCIAVFVSQFGVAYILLGDRLEWSSTVALLCGATTAVAAVTCRP